MPLTIEDAARTAYYRCALGLLHFVEHRAGRNQRFGPDADARWTAFAGSLDISDRIDLLLRDADREWSAAFGPRATFGLRAVHEHDAFGSEWVPLDGPESVALWKQLASAKRPASNAELLRILCATWSVEPVPFDSAAVAPGTRVVVAGTSAIVSILERLSTNEDLAWADVVVVADDPGPRQLAAAATALLNLTEPTTLVHSDELSPNSARIKQLRTDKGGAWLMLVSPDASPAERQAASALGGQP